MTTNSTTAYLKRLLYQLGLIPGHSFFEMRIQNWVLSHKFSTTERPKTTQYPNNNQHMQMSFYRDTALPKPSFRNISTSQQQPAMKVKTHVSILHGPMMRSVESHGHGDAQQATARKTPVNKERHTVISTPTSPGKAPAQGVSTTTTPTLPQKMTRRSHKSWALKLPDALRDTPILRSSLIQNQTKKVTAVTSSTTMCPRNIDAVK